MRVSVMAVGALVLLTACQSAPTAGSPGYGTSRGDVYRTLDGGAHWTLTTAGWS